MGNTWFPPICVCSGKQEPARGAGAQRLPVRDTLGLPDAGIVNEPHTT